MEGATSDAADADACPLISLPEEVLDVICGHAAAALDGPATLARLTATCVRVFQLCP